VRLWRWESSRFGWCLAGIGAGILRTVGWMWRHRSGGSRGVAVAAVCFPYSAKNLA